MESDVMLRVINGNRIYDHELGSDLVVDLVRGITPSDLVIKDELYEICDSQHAQCNDDCPVFLLLTLEEKKNFRDCACFKNSTAMLEFIRSRI